MVINHILKVKISLFLATSYTLLILLLSLVNLNEIQIIEINASDKLYHAVCYALLSFLWIYFVKIKYHLINLRRFVVVGSFTTLFGIIIEYFQLILTEYRMFDWWDALANFFGVLLGILLFSIIQKVVKV